MLHSYKIYCKQLVINRTGNHWPPLPRIISMLSIQVTARDNRIELGSTVLFE